MTTAEVTVDVPSASVTVPGKIGGMSLSNALGTANMLTPSAALALGSPTPLLWL